MFQFLDGAIKRNVHGFTSISEVAFQFLDGAIKRADHYSNRREAENVSIP